MIFLLSFLPSRYRIFLSCFPFFYFSFAFFFFSSSFPCLWSMICDEYKQRARISLYQRSRVFNVVQPLHDNDSERTCGEEKEKNKRSGERHASRNGWRVWRTEWTKSSVQINIKRIFKLNATKYLVVCSCVVNEVRAVLISTSCSFTASRSRFLS